MLQWMIHRERENCISIRFIWNFERGNGRKSYMNISILFYWMPASALSTNRIDTHTLTHSRQTRTTRISYHLLHSFKGTYSICCCTKQTIAGYVGVKCIFRFGAESIVIIDCGQSYQCGIADWSSKWWWIQITRLWQLFHFTWVNRWRWDFYEWYKWQFLSAIGAGKVLHFDGIVHVVILFIDIGSGWLADKRELTFIIPADRFVTIVQFVGVQNHIVGWKRCTAQLIKIIIRLFKQAR